MQRANLMELKGDIDVFAITIGNFIISPSMIDRPSRFLKICKNTENMNTINELNLTDIHRPQQPKMVEYTLKCIWNILQKKPPAGT